MAAGSAALANGPQGVEVREADAHDTSAPLWLLQPAPRGQEKDHPVMRLPIHPAATTGEDPLLHRPGPNAPLPQAPPVLWQFLGVGQNFVNTDGSVVQDQVAPPDTNGDIGPDHYISLVNSEFAIFSKKDNSVLYGSVPTNTVFQGFTGGSGLCASTDDGDGVVLYDPIADRWILSQLGIDFNTFNPPYYECVAVSASGDPTGQWNRYAFGPYTVPGAGGAQDPALNDYPKLGVWPDAIYATFNMFDLTTGFTFAGSKLCAWDRVKMLAGQAATEQCFQMDVTVGGIIPVDFDGPPTQQPAVGAPGLFVGYEVLVDAGTTLDFWKFHVDFATPANSTLNGAKVPPFVPENVAGAAHIFEGVCGTPPNTSITCVPQPVDGQGQLLDTLGDRMMFRASYRKVGTDAGYESVLATHTVNTTGATAPPTGVRWYEVRAPFGPTVSVFQQGTFAPDNNFRWMGAIAQDKFGNIGLGYSVSNATTIEPEIRYTAHAFGDPNGTMEGERVMFDGGAGQNGGLNRWGDYSDMVVDPVDDCTFWYTQEYLETSGSFNWSTRVGSFRFPQCLPIAGYVLTGPTTVTAGTSNAYALKAVDRSGTTLAAYSGTAAITSSDPGVVGGNVTITAGIGALNVTFTKAGTQTLTVADLTNPLLRAIDTVTVNPGPASQYILAALPTAVVAGQTVTFNATAEDQYGNVASAYAGTATASSTDARAALPPNPTFAAGLVSGLTVTFAKAGAQTVTLTDSSNATIKGSAPTTVSPSVLATYGIQGLGATVGAGAANALTLLAQDTYGNAISSYTGAAKLTSTDSAATLPASNPAFVAGVASNVSVTFNTLGAQSLTASDASGLPVSTTATTIVTSGTATKYVLRGLPSTIPAGIESAVDVVAEDATGNVVASYNGSANLTSGDTQATIPATVPFVNGVASSIPVVFGTLGAQTLTATDTVAATITVSGSVTVVAGEAAKYTLTGLPDPVLPGSSATVNINATDKYGNAAADYVGKAKLTSTDSSATLPSAPVAFTAGLAKNVPVTFATNGLQALTATDSTDPHITGQVLTNVGSFVDNGDGGLSNPKLKSGCGCGAGTGSGSAAASMGLLAFAMLASLRRRSRL